MLEFYVAIHFLYLRDFFFIKKIKKNKKIFLSNFIKRINNLSRNLMFSCNNVYFMGKKRKRNSFQGFQPVSLSNLRFHAKIFFFFQKWTSFRFQFQEINGSCDLILIRIYAYALPFSSFSLQFNAHAFLHKRTAANTFV